jgi:uncharacterized protein (DUF427 family)
MERITPQQGQESVWDYPRPPHIEPSNNAIRILFGGEIIAQTKGAYRVLETSHPPVFYISPSDIKMEFLVESRKSSFCEWKGAARYYAIAVNNKRVENAAWYYPEPTPAFAPIRNFVAFYPSKMDACFVNDELVQSQKGDFYGGWITSEIVGPFKGGSGTAGW